MGQVSHIPRGRGRGEGRGGRGGGRGGGGPVGDAGDDDSDGDGIGRAADPDRDSDSDVDPELRIRYRDDDGDDWTDDSDLAACAAAIERELAGDFGEDVSDDDDVIESTAAESDMVKAAMASKKDADVLRVIEEECSEGADDDDADGPRPARRPAGATKPLAAFRRLSSLEGCQGVFFAI